MSTTPRKALPSTAYVAARPPLTDESGSAAPLVSAAAAISGVTNEAAAAPPRARLVAFADVAGVASGAKAVAAATKTRARRGMVLFLVQAVSELMESTFVEVHAVAEGGPGWNQLVECNSCVINNEPRATDSPRAKL